MGFLRLVAVDLVAGVLVFFAVPVAGVDGIVPSPAKRFLLFLRILPKCSVRAFLVGAAPKEAAVIDRLDGNPSREQVGREGVDHEERDASR